jgi:hypothetical protein
MNDGRRAELEARVEQLEAAVGALLSEYAAARSRLEDVETAAGATAREAEPTVRDEPTARGATVPPDREATQEEVERAVRALEEETEGEREEAGLVES